MVKFLERNYIMVFFLPAALLAALLIVYPISYGIYVSFFDTNLINKWNFVGGDNYLALLHNKAFLNSLWVNIRYIVFVVIGHFALGTLLAVQLNKPIKGRTLYRCLLLLPWLVPEVVFAILFKWVANPQYGIINFTLMNLGLLRDPVSWLGDINLAFYSVVFISIIKGFPMVMIMVLAALQTVSNDIYEAARIDGCSERALFSRITVPAILPVLTVTLILDTVNWFKHYTMVAILTGGGPANTTSLVSVTIYKTAFSSFKFGLAGAMAVIVFIICFIIGLVYRRMTDARD